MGTRETLAAIHARGDLEPWLRGETDCVYSGEIITCIDYGDPSDYQFRPKPKPVLRAWTWEELWERRDCWFKHKTNNQRSRMMGYGIKSMYLGTGDMWTLEEMMASLEYLAPDGTWQPCGVLETQ